METLGVFIILLALALGFIAFKWRRDECLRLRAALEEIAGFKTSPYELLNVAIEIARAALSEPNKDKS